MSDQRFIRELKELLAKDIRNACARNTNPYAKLKACMSTLVYKIQVPGLLCFFGFLSRPWSLIGNLVADSRPGRFDASWPQTWTRYAALRCCPALPFGNRHIDLAVAGDAALRSPDRSGTRCCTLGFALRFALRNTFVK